MSGMSPHEYLVYELKGRYKFTQDHAQDAAERLMWDQNVYKGFVDYLNKGTLSNYSIQGHTVESLVRDYKLDPLGAFLMLAEFSRFPDRARRYLQMILDEGHEEIVTGEDGEIEIEFSYVEPPEGAAPVKDAPKCEKCGGELTWIEEYQRWYCYSCKEYAE